MNRTSGTDRLIYFDATSDDSGTGNAVVAAELTGTGGAVIGIAGEEGVNTTRNLLEDGDQSPRFSLL